MCFEFTSFFNAAWVILASSLILAWLRNRHLTVVAAAPVTQRFLLYDVTHGQGFNLQREVYPRAAWAVAKLNSLLESRCRDKVRDGECARWALVLPPWCDSTRKLHTGSNHMPWSELFDPAALHATAVPVLEFDEYMRVAGGNLVDMALVMDDHADEQLLNRADIMQAEGDFAGWAIEEDLDNCGFPRHLRAHRQGMSNGSQNVIYGNFCDGGLRAGELRCALFERPSRAPVVQLLSQVESDITSVLVKDYDYFDMPPQTEMDELGLRESMIFSAELRNYADIFANETLQGWPYLAADCRQADFLQLKPFTELKISMVAARLNKLLARHKLDRVVVATDASVGLRNQLRQEIMGTVYFSDAATSSVDLDDPGKQAIVDLWLASRAAVFIGTAGSGFSSAVRTERGLLGKPWDTSAQEFCRSPELDSCHVPDKHDVV